MDTVDKVWKYTNPFFVVPMLPVVLGIFTAAVVKQGYKFTCSVFNDCGKCMKDL